MKRIGLTIAAGLLAACVAFSSDIGTKTVSVTTTATNAATRVTGTFADIVGEVESIWMDAPSGTPTGNVSVSYQPALSTLAPVVLATNSAMTADAVYRPRVDVTDNAGNSLTNDPPAKYTIRGETVTVAIDSANVTSQTWNVYFKWIKK